MQNPLWLVCMVFFLILNLHNRLNVSFRYYGLCDWSGDGDAGEGDVSLDSQYFWYRQSRRTGEYFCFFVCRKMSPLFVCFVGLSFIKGKSLKT